MGYKLKKDFYTREDVVSVSRDLLGKILFTRVNGIITAGRIIETEAYSSGDRACHAYNFNKTGRNKVMFEEGGVAYVYFVYGIHFLFNVVTNKKEKPDAALIRAIEPVLGMDIMMKRRGKSTLHKITSGPGILTRAMGIDLRMNGQSLLSKSAWIEENSGDSINFEIIRTARIGVDYAGEDAELPWRFYIKDNAWVSKK